MDISTIISTAFGVLVGGLITWITSAYFANEAAKDMKSLLQRIADVSGDIRKLPNDVQKKLSDKQLQMIGSVLAPLLVPVAKAFVEDRKRKDTAGS